MIDLAATVEAKVDQLTADELLGGPRKILITKVTGSDSPDQPVSIHFDGDQGKPFKPCKTMRRVLMHMWGRDASTFSGRSLVLYRDETVKFGGLQVGGVRISHASHIDREMNIPVTMKRGQKAPVKIKPIKAEVTALKAVADTRVDDTTPTFDFPEFEGIVDLALVNFDTAADLKSWWEGQKPIRMEAGKTDRQRAISIANKVGARVTELETK